MRGIFLVSCFLGGSALLAGCREENNSPARPRKMPRALPAHANGEKADPRCKNGNWTALPVLPFPFRMTCRPGSWSARRAKSISSLKLPEIRHVLNPTRKRFPRRELPCAWSPYREERSSWGVPRKSRTGNRTKDRSIK
ncbi:hypothetical protein M5E88_09220 [Akkermansia muciniphila]|nr:hypothetical protein M5E88_09220 [Akkermansia muciniphila]